MVIAQKEIGIITLIKHQPYFFDRVIAPQKIFDRFDRMFMLRDGRLEDIVRVSDAA